MLAPSPYKQGFVPGLLEAATTGLGLYNAGRAQAQQQDIARREQARREQDTQSEIAGRAAIAEYHKAHAKAAEMQNRGAELELQIKQRKHEIEQRMGLADVDITTLTPETKLRLGHLLRTGGMVPNPQRPSAREAASVGILPSSIGFAEDSEEAARNLAALQTGGVTPKEQAILASREKIVAAIAAARAKRDADINAQRARILAAQGAAAMTAIEQKNLARYDAQLARVQSTLAPYREARRKNELDPVSTTDLFRYEQEEHDILEARATYQQQIEDRQLAAATAPAQAPVPRGSTFVPYTPGQASSVTPETSPRAKLDALLKQALTLDITRRPEARDVSGMLSAYQAGAQGGTLDPERAIQTSAGFKAAAARTGQTAIPVAPLLPPVTRGGTPRPAGVVPSGRVITPGTPMPRAFTPGAPPVVETVALKRLREEQAKAAKAARATAESTAVARTQAVNKAVEDYTKAWNESEEPKRPGADTKLRANLDVIRRGAKAEQDKAKLDAGGADTVKALASEYYPSAAKRQMSIGEMRDAVRRSIDERIKVRQSIVLPAKAATGTTAIQEKMQAGLEKIFK